MRFRSWSVKAGHMVFAAALWVSFSPRPAAQGIPDQSGALRQFPGGTEVQGLRAGMPLAQAAAALRTHADSELPGGFRVSDVQPVVGRAGGNRIFRFRLEYGGVKLAQSSDFMAVVGAGGTLLASRLRNVPSSVDATLPGVDPSVAAQSAMEHARTALGQSGVLTTTPPAVAIW